MKPWISAEVPAIMSGQGMDEYIVANLGYKARPLDGIWATPPYLHNSSVPNLYEMLVPAARRTAKFYLGSTRYRSQARRLRNPTVPRCLPDGYNQAGQPQHGPRVSQPDAGRAGRKGRKSSGTAKRAATERWAFVFGKDFGSLSRDVGQRALGATRDTTRVELENHEGEPIPGLYGPEFTDEERWQLVEYLKSL